MRAVSDERVLTPSAAGTADDVAARISALLKAGLKQAVLFCCNANVRFWHKADKSNLLLFVRFQG